MAKIHRSENVSEERRRRTKRTMNHNPGVLERREETDDIINEPFSLAKIVRDGESNK